MNLTRRAVLLGLTVESLLALQHAHQAVQSTSAGFVFFDPATAAEVDALASTILPSDGTPGAKEAGVVYFIDKALATFDQDQRPAFRAGLDLVQTKRRELFPGAPSVAALTPGQREQLLRTIEATPFFEMLRTYTMIGFLASPEWGGNRGKVGWKLIGYDDSSVFQPPFGYYDTPGAAQ